jgi:hypothetical protein
MNQNEADRECMIICVYCNRMTSLGFRSSVPGQEAVPGVPGPMANRVDDLELLMRAVVVR